MPEDPILAIDDPRLKRPSRTVTAIDDRVRAIAGRMFEIMDREQGAGLAAIQIGIAERIVVMDVPDEAGTRHRLALVNPEVIERSEAMRTGEEGCLSMPGHYLPVDRAAWVRVRYSDLDGRECEIEGDGLLSVCLQHEIDHTNGVLFTDHVSRLRRERARAHFAKIRRQAGAQVSA